MGYQYTEDGERLEFVGLEEAHIRGSLQKDEVGSWWINDVSESDLQSLYSIIPEDVQEDEEYTFAVRICARKPTGEYRDE